MGIKNFLGQKKVDFKNKLWTRLEKVQAASLSRVTPRSSLVLEVALAEHCNLNCAGCSHFSPLAEPEVVDVDELTRDFKRLYELFGNRVTRLYLLGGEPMLHPELLKILKMTRTIFPNTYIAMLTNGVKLPAQPEEFWETCRECSIAIAPTKYPIKLDYDALEQKAREHGVEYYYYGGGGLVKTLEKYPLDLKGHQDASIMFLQCMLANSCTTLSHGRLFACPVASNARHFNRHFDADLQVLPEDSINIYEAKSAREIFEFLARPIPFCRYCMRGNVQRGIPWHQSKKTIDEWTL